MGAAEPSLRILIADDHPRFRLALRHDLEEAGHEICAEAGTGTEAVVAALRERPDLCFIDNHMPAEGETAFPRRLLRPLLRAVRQAS